MYPDHCVNYFLRARSTNSVQLLIRTSLSCLLHPHQSSDCSEPLQTKKTSRVRTWLKYRLVRSHGPANQRVLWKFHQLSDLSKTSKHETDMFFVLLCIPRHRNNTTATRVAHKKYADSPPFYFSLWEALQN